MLNNKITSDVTLAATYLKTGNLVAFPTETVYGLGADANNPTAILKVFQAKGRPSDHPLIVHIAQVEQLTDWAQNIPTTAWQLAQHFWPGPLTLILDKQPHVSPLITGGQATIAIRIPNHPLTLELLQQFGSGIVGPSANKYGRISPTSAAHVAADLGAEVAAILDGGMCDVGIESTIINLTAAEPTVMRLGAISAKQIGKVLGCAVKTSQQQDNQIRTSGSHLSHYAPRTPTILVDPKQLLAQVSDPNRSCSVLSFQAKPTSLAVNCYWQTVSMDPAQYAHDLYANLRTHDNLATSQILIEKPPQQEAWIAILDRLTRAASKD